MFHSKFIVYGLVDPRDGYLRYIGKSSSGLERPRRHCRPSQLLREQSRKARWLRELVRIGIRPNVIVLFDAGAQEILNQAEKFWIRYFRSLGFDLMNSSQGGEGSHFWHQTEAARSKISIARRGKKSSLDHCRNMAAARGGKPFSDENGCVYYTMREAALALGASKQHINDVLKGRLKSTHGHNFRYV